MTADELLQLNSYNRQLDRLQGFHDSEHKKTAMGDAQQHIRTVKLMRLRTEIGKVERRRARWVEGVG